MYKEYNTNQLNLELNLAYDIPMTHEARLINLFVDSIPRQVLLEEKSHTSRPAFHPAMLLKMTLFAYARQVFSGRKIVQMNEEVIPMKWLSQDTYVSYKSINNFRASKHANNLIKIAFIYFTLLMRDNGLIEDEVLFSDGTKLEADANLYSFTWKKAIKRYEEALNGNISELYDKLIQEGVDLALSGENYSFIIDELEKTPLIPYGMYQKERTRTYKNSPSPSNPDNWDYVEDRDQFVKPDGVVYSFKKTDKYGFQRDFKIYEADNIQDTPELEQLAKTESGRQKQIHYNPIWNYFKDHIKKSLHSENGSRIYAKRKTDVEPVFGRLKSVFGVRRVHVRGHQAVQTEIGFLFMSMNLTKLAKKLALKTLNTQKPHRDSLILIIFKTVITVWFIFEETFCPASFCLNVTRLSNFYVYCFSF